MPDFLRWLVVKAKYRPKVNVEKEMRTAISKLEPRFEQIVKDIYETNELVPISLNVS